MQEIQGIPEPSDTLKPCMELHASPQLSFIPTPQLRVPPQLFWKCPNPPNTAKFEIFQPFSVGGLTLCEDIFSV